MKILALTQTDSAMSMAMIDALLRRPVAVDCVVIDPLPVSVRHQALWEERTAGAIPLLSTHDLPQPVPEFVALDDHNAERTVAFIRDRGPDLIVNAGTPRILKAPILSTPRLGTLNVHPGWLPKYRGCSCVEWAILNDDPVANTVHLMTEGIDDGPILARESVAIDGRDSYVDLRVKVYRRSVDLMARVVQRIEETGALPDPIEAAEPSQYWKPIPDDLFFEVRKKVDEGRYQEAIQS